MKIYTHQKYNDKIDKKIFIVSAIKNSVNNISLNYLQK